MLLGMKQAMARLDNVWGEGGGTKAVESLAHKVGDAPTRPSKLPWTLLRPPPTHTQPYQPPAPSTLLWTPPHPATSRYSPHKPLCTPNYSYQLLYTPINPSTPLSAPLHPYQPLYAPINPSTSTTQSLANRRLVSTKSRVLMKYITPDIITHIRLL